MSEATQHTAGAEAPKPKMPLRVLWEEIMKRFRCVEVVGAPQRTLSAFVKGYTELPARVHDR